MLKARAAELQTWVAVHPDDSLAWSGLAQTWARLGVPLRALRAEAESRYALGDLLGAVDRLRAGQRMGRAGGPVDFIDASVLDSRLRAIEGERRQIAGRPARVALARPTSSHKPHAPFAAPSSSALRLAPTSSGESEMKSRIGAVLGAIVVLAGSGAAGAARSSP